MFITISTSSAPLAIASLVSKALTAEVFAPKGKPITVHTFTSLPFSSSFASSIFAGFIQTEKNPFSFASLHILTSSSLVVVSYSIVLSIILAICVLFISILQN